MGCRRRFAFRRRRVATPLAATAAPLLSTYAAFVPCAGKVASVLALPVLVIDIDLCTFSPSTSRELRRGRALVATVAPASPAIAGVPGRLRRLYFRWF